MKKEIVQIRNMHYFKGILQFLKIYIQFENEALEHNYLLDPTLFWLVFSSLRAPAPIK